MKRATLAWLELANRDLKAAIKLAEDEHLAGLALFHCQQCVEKCLKAILEEQGLKPPRVHSIHRLSTIVQEKTGVVPLLSDEEMDLIDNIYTDTGIPAALAYCPPAPPPKSKP